MANWAKAEPSVHALVLIGSRERAARDKIWRADEHSDWDFHVITSRPGMFFDSAWTRQLPGMSLRVYAPRVARIGGVPKVNVIFDGAEADFVVLPLRPFDVLRKRSDSAVARRVPSNYQRLQELAVVVRPGWRFLKGARKWEPLYRRAVRHVADPRISDAAACRLADAFACDYVSLQRKIARGELIAAQRLLHRDLVEINFRLLHEIKLRRGERSFPEVRRVERIATKEELEALTIEAAVNVPSLEAALQKSRATCCRFMRDLVGPSWKWPDV